MTIEIKDDLYSIAARLKELSPDYGIVFDTDRQSFVVTQNGSPVLTVPYDELDERTLRQVVYTRSDNIKNVVADIEKNNKNIAERSVKRAQDRLEDDFSRAARLLGV